jgi:four helix bundle protein
MSEKAELEAGGWRLGAGGANYGNAVEDLDVWRRAMAVAERVYQATASLPPDERFGLTSQMRRAAVSVPSNIAEGHALGRGAACAQFIRHARGSLSELRSQLQLAVRLGYLDAGANTSLMDETAVLLAQLQRFIQAQTQDLRG